MKKRVSILIGLVGLVICLFAATAMAETRSSGVFIYEVKGNGTATIVGYTGGQDDIILPNLIDGYTITTIGDEAFAAREIQETSVSVTIPETVTSIGEKAFWQRNVRSINIPDNTQYIGAGAFVGCIGCQYRISSSHPQYAVIDDNLYDKTQKMLIAASGDIVNIPNGILSIGDYACYGLTYYNWRLSSSRAPSTFPETLESLGDDRDDRYAFMKQSPLFVILPDSLTDIGNYSFCWNQLCVKMKDLVESPFFPQALNSIGNYAFSNCAFIPGSARDDKYDVLDSNVFFSDSLISIGDYAFANSWFIASNKYGLQLTMPTGLRKLGIGAFRDTISYYSDDNYYNMRWAKFLISFADSTALRDIPEMAFFNSGEGHVYIIDFGNIETIGPSAFCDTVISCSLPNTIMELGTACFMDTYIENDDNSIVIPASCEVISEDVFKNARFKSGSLILSDGVKRIESRALTFDLSDTYLSIQLPSSLSFISDDALPINASYTTVKGCYAERWLQENAYPYKIEGEEQDLDWLNN